MAKAALVPLLLVAIAAGSDAQTQTKAKPKGTNEYQTQTTAKPKGTNENVLNTAMILEFASNTKDLTRDLLSFIGSESYALVSKQTAPVEKLFWEQHAEGHKLYKMHAKEHVDKVSKVVSDSYAAVLAIVSPVLTQVKEAVMRAGDSVAMQANALMDVYVSSMEKAHPERKGAIPKDFASRMLLLVYIVAVICLSLRVCIFVLRKVFGIFCYVLCCGACRKRNSAKDSKQKPASKASAKSAQGKTTPAAKKKTR